MTNADIIFNASQALAEQGKIAYTGKTFKAVAEDGTEIILKETEPIHTYNTWKELGYQVQKGQKAIAQFMIWKHTEKRNDDGELLDSKMFMKRASFFSLAQVEGVM